MSQKIKKPALDEVLSRKRHGWRRGPPVGALIARRASPTRLSRLCRGQPPRSSSLPAPGAVFVWGLGLGSGFGFRYCRECAYQHSEI